ncbi:SLC13 family permease [Paracoccaceae bacterium]|nr:SLC13 family permease [Paracoccaceae bacterium]
MEYIPLNPEMVMVLGFIFLTLFLFISEIVRVDVAAIIVMVLLGAASYIPGFTNIADINHLFDGFASNAVMSIIAVMVIGAGMDKTGLMSKVAAYIMNIGGATEARIVPIIGATVGIISSFMQNVGAAALFLPVVSRISARTEIGLGRLLMPMGFCAILGGTMTMVGSSPLILLNDLILSTNKDLPPQQQMVPFELFAVTPIGVSLVFTGILYFIIFGRFVLPRPNAEQGGVSGQSTQGYLKRLYGLKADLVEVEVPEHSLLVSHTLADISEANNLYVIGTHFKGKTALASPNDTVIEGPCRLAMLGRHRVISEFSALFDVTVLPKLDVFAEDVSAAKAGIAEILIPPDSDLIGKTARETRLRAVHGMSLLAIRRGETTFSHVQTADHDATRLSIEPLQTGDIMVVHVTWEALTRINKDRDFVVVTTDFPQEEVRPQKVGWALFFFVVAFGLILLTDIRLSLALLIGAIGMIITKVLSIDEAYSAVSWNTVFLLASLLPLGQAVQSTGTAEWLAYQVLLLLEGWPVWGLQVVIALLATVFTLVMSNVGATVLLVPLAVSIALAAGGDPAIFAMTVAISTSNSFLIPTHQVNALIMGPARYRVTDFIRAGGGMTLLFLLVSISMMNLIF